MSTHRDRGSRQADPDKLKALLRGRLGTASFRGFLKAVERVAGPHSISRTTVHNILNGKPIQQFTWETVEEVLGVPFATIERVSVAIEQSSLVGENGDISPENRDVVTRVKLVAGMNEHYRRLAYGPKHGAVVVDVSGMTTGFTNWLDDDLFRSILVANNEYAQAYRRCAGSKGIGIHRSLIIDPERMTEQSVHNLERVLIQHVRLGFHAAIIYQSKRIPEELMGDLGLLDDTLAFDFGRFLTAPVELFQSRKTKLFVDIKDRVIWTTDRNNIDALIKAPEDVRDFMQDLRRKAK